MDPAPWRSDRPLDEKLVMSEYGGRVDRGFRERLRFQARFVALLEYGSGLDPTSPADADAGRRYVEWASPRFD